jgi:hypothetical protein
MSNFMSHRAPKQCAHSDHRRSDRMLRRRQQLLIIARDAGTDEIYALDWEAP